MLTTWRGLKAAGKGGRQEQPTLLPFSWPQYQQPLPQSVRMLEDMSRPSIRVECVKYILSVACTVLFIIFIKHTETETVSTSHWQILLNQKLGYSWEGYTTPQLRAPCSVSRHISQSLTSCSDHISSVCTRSRTHYVLYIIAVVWSTSLKVNEFNGFNDLCQTASVNDVDCWNGTLFTNNFMFIVSYCCYKTL